MVNIVLLNGTTDCCHLGEEDGSAQELFIRLVDQRLRPRQIYEMVMERARW